MEILGVDLRGAGIMAPKTMFKIFKIEGIRSYAANIIKQHLLSLGADAAISRDSLVKDTVTDIMIFGTLAQLKAFAGKIRKQPFGLGKISEELALALKGKTPVPVFTARDKRITLNKPCICGIINATPDSFSGDGIFAGELSCREREKVILNKAESMIKSGAEMLDIGAESSRPFSSPVGEEEEIKRLGVVLKPVRKKFPGTVISVDTYRYGAAKFAVEQGADVINDISALRHSPEITSLIKKHKLGCVLMHMKGTPSNMQVSPDYDRPVSEIRSFLSERIGFCLERGIQANQLMIDPGIGFGKQLKHNVEIIRNLSVFKSLGVPVFLGVSRKAFIGNILKKQVRERLTGSLTVGIMSVLNGADVLRVHDVEEFGQAMKIFDKCRS